MPESDPHSSAAMTAASWQSAVGTHSGELKKGNRRVESFRCLTRVTASAVRAITLACYIESSSRTGDKLFILCIVHHKSTESIARLYAKFMSDLSFSRLVDVGTYVVTAGELA